MIIVFIIGFLFGIALTMFYNLICNISKNKRTSINKWGLHEGKYKSNEKQFSYISRPPHRPKPQKLNL